MSGSSFAPVAVSECREYDADRIFDILSEQARSLGINEGDFAGKRIAIKPNLVMKRSPEFAATSHPAMLEATVRLIRSLGGEDIVVAESPGCPYTESLLRSYYAGTGIAEAAERAGVRLNYDVGYVETPCPDGVASRMYNIITPIAECDVIVDLCKLKTHTLALMSAAMKNVFGVVPGIQKFEMHSRFPAPTDFFGMVVELCHMLTTTKNFIAIADGVVGMEGNGPTGGTPREVGAVLMSRSPYCLDIAAEELLGLAGEVEMLDIAARRGLCPRSAAELDVIKSGEPPRMTDYRRPDTHKSILRKLPTLFGGRLTKLLEPRPRINYKKCVGCGECMRACPAHTITLIPAKSAGAKKQAQIDPSRCIKCFCCQELCTFRAVDIAKNPIITMLK